MSGCNTNKICEVVKIDYPEERNYSIEYYTVFYDKELDCYSHEKGGLIYPCGVWKQVQYAECIAWTKGEIPQ